MREGGSEGGERESITERGDPLLQLVEISTRQKMLIKSMHVRKTINMTGRHWSSQ